MANRLDIIIFGATGFTAKYVLMHAYKVYKNVSWGVAGRNENKLKQALREAAKPENVSDFKNVPIIIADVEDEETIRNMTSQAKVIVNCCGPYGLNRGEMIIKCCIETKTHYVDTSIEDLFIKNVLSHEKSAEESGVYIVNSCGFNVVLCDLGVCFMEKEFKGILNSVEIYYKAQTYGSCADQPFINYTSWKSAINVLTINGQLKTKKTQFKEKKNIKLQPKLTTRLPHTFKNEFALAFPGADEKAIGRSQLFFYESENKRPIQIRTYLIMNSFYTIIKTVLLGLLCFILAQFAFGKNLLLKYPESFSNRVFSHGNPSEEALNQRRFLLTFKGRGWTKELLDSDKNYQSPPNKEIVGCMSGINPGYGVTGLAVVLCALMVLSEPKNLPARGGIYTPAAAFSKTSLNEQLQKNGINYGILSKTDLK